MKLYVTYTSPYARLARIVIAQKGLAGRVEIVEAKTRNAGSAYYQINPSGRVPYLVDDEGIGMEDSQVICAYLDRLDGTPWLHTRPDDDWAYRRVEAVARSLCDGIAVWTREMRRPENERSPTILTHEAARSERLADHFETEVSKPLLQGAPTMAHLVLAVALDTVRMRGLGDLTTSRPGLRRWMERMSQLPGMLATAW
jgi:glutathione S-transferase